MMLTDEMKKENARKVVNRRLLDMYVNDAMKPACAPFDTLGKEIINKLSIVDGKILVFSDLGLLIALCVRLTTEGKNFEGITFIAHSSNQKACAERNGVKVIYIGYENLDRLEESLVGLKFDIIIGNPPYQPSIQRKTGKRSGSGSGTSIWQHFVICAFNHVVKNGYIAFIHPNSWRQTSVKPNPRYNEVKTLLFDHRVEWLMINADKFFEIGNSLEIDAYIVQKSLRVSEEKTRVMNALSNETYELELTTMIPIQLDAITISILEKITRDLSEKIKISVTPRKFASNANFISAVLDDNHSFEFLNTAAQYKKGKRLWSAIQHPNQNLQKIILCDSGDFGFFADFSGKYGMCHHTHSIIINDRERGLLDFLTSDLITFFLSRFKKPGSMYVPIQAITFLPKITNIDELYKKFNLTLEEQKYIQASVQ